MAVGYAGIPTDRLSLVVGVTGHRDIAPSDEAPLRNAFGGVLRALAQECPHATLIVLSGLAAGADSLAAEEALAQDIPVIACLPMPVVEYERDFSPEELARFRALLASCARVTVTSPQRENGYVATGLYIAQYSHVLVAFWDGVDSRGKGGTSDVVDMRMTGRARSSGEIVSVPYLPDLGPVYQIVTPRLAGPRPAEAFALKPRYPQRYPHDTTSESDFHLILGRIDLYNSDLANTPETVKTDDPLNDLMEHTDATANRLQHRTNIFRHFLFACAFIAAAVQLAPPAWLFTSEQLAVFKVFWLVVAFVAYGVARRNDYENRYQDYRALAEGLRVQDAWYCAGLTHYLADRSYLRMQEGELQWIRMALRAAYLALCAGGEPPGASPEHPNTIAWVNSQWHYYQGASRREYDKKRLVKRAATIVLAVGVASTIVSAAILLSGHKSLLVGYTLTIPLALAAMFSALSSHYLERESVEVNARRYERMFHVFDKAHGDLETVRGNEHQSESILVGLGRAALIEHADWLIMRRDRPMRVESV